MTKTKTKLTPAKKYAEMIRDKCCQNQYVICVPAVTKIIEQVQEEVLNKKKAK